jgi:hypothetical protein
MKVTAPLASSFMIYLMSITTGTFFLKRSIKALAIKNIKLAALLIFAMISAFTFSLFVNNGASKASQISYDTTVQFVANQPIEEAKGLYPGRVVWLHNKAATNENWNKNSALHATNDANVNQQVVDSMLLRGIRYLTQSNTDEGAWEKLFRNFNVQHARTDRGYLPGEKIAIKINLTNNGIMSGERCDATPQVVYAILNQLVNVVGVPQPDITIGDPYRDFSSIYIQKCTTNFPDVNYIGNKTKENVKQSVPSKEKVLVFSDKQETSTLPQPYLDATYLINIPILKSHGSNGISIAAKNHQGSVMQPDGTPDNQSAKFMDYAFPHKNPGHKKYRHLVDYMGHEQLRGKTLLYLVDAL